MVQSRPHLTRIDADPADIHQNGDHRGGPKEFLRGQAGLGQEGAPESALVPGEAAEESA